MTVAMAAVVACVADCAAVVASRLLPCLSA